MAEVDAEIVERVARWCAEARRPASAGEIRRALAPLGWDELLTVKALLADPPPARPLGPYALADIARGAPADVAAEREREGRYRLEGGEAPEPPPAPGAPPPRAAPRRRSARPQVVIHRARDRAPAPPQAPRPLPLLDELRRPEGRTVLERLVRRTGARRHALAGALAAGWRREDGAPPGEDDLAALLEHHGLERGFARRERDELLHAVRAEGGVLARAAGRLALDAEGLRAALVRVGADEEAERIRAARRSELRGRATLSERAHLLLEDELRLRDLGLLEEMERDLRARLPEHVRALRAGGEPLAPALARSLSLPHAAAAQLVDRFDLTPRARAEPPPAPGEASRKPPRRRGWRERLVPGAAAGADRRPEGRRAPGPSRKDERRPPRGPPGKRRGGPRGRPARGR